MSKLDRTRYIIEQLLENAGVKVDGNDPWDFQVKDQRVFERVLSEGSLGLGESYMDGWWDVERLDQFFERIISAKLSSRIKKDLKTLWNYFVAVVFNLQSESRSFVVGERHYDLGNSIYENMLDERLVYSCGYWKEADNLDQAQKAKLDLICRKLKLAKGMKVLDIGCGWGSFAKYAAENYGVSVVGITVSKEQIELAKKLCANLPIEIRLQDYRELEGKFDRVVSIGMFEHVGRKNYREFFQIVDACLKENGLFLLHTIGGNFSGVSVEPWIGKYIFPNGMLPSIKQIGKAVENLFVVEDLHNFGADYDKTLMAWFENFEKNWEKLEKSYDERFYRMWKYYLLSCAGSFRARNIQLWQLVFSKEGIAEGYESVR